MTEGGRKGGKVSKVLPARGAHGLMLASSDGLKRTSVCVCWGRGSNCKQHTTVAAAANHPCNDEEPKRVRGWVVVVGE